MAISICLLLVLLCILFRFVYIKLIRVKTFWKELNILFPKPAPVFGNIDIKDLMFGRRNLIYIYDDFYKVFNQQRFFGIYELQSPNLLIRDVELANRILVNDFNYFHDRSAHIDETLNPLNAHLVNLCGSRWRSTRSKLMPAFSTGKLKQMFGLIEDCANELEEHLLPFVKHGDAVEVREVMAKFATDVIGRCALGLEFNTLKNPNSEFRVIGRKIFSFNFKLMVRICLRLICPALLKIVRIKTVCVEVEKFFFRMLADAIACRKSQLERRVDFLQIMIDVQEQEQEQEANSNRKIENAFSDTLLVANMFVFFAAGFETIANTLSFCLYELALNPSVQTKLQKEVLDAVVECRPLNYDIVTTLPYLDMVVSETLRKYAPLPVISRICTRDYQIPDTRTILRKNTRITLPIHSYHYDEQYFPNAQQFLPERFENDDKPSPAYLPFGNGPRICIGLKLAKLEMKLCLAAMVSKYSFSPCVETEIPLQIKARAIFLTPKNGIKLNIRKIDRPSSG